MHWSVVYLVQEPSSGRSTIVMPDGQFAQRTQSRRSQTVFVDAAV